MGRRLLPLYLMLIPGIVLTIIFAYLPMGGLIIAFKDYKPWVGIWDSPWVGLDNFREIFLRDDSVQVIWNTVIISFWKIAGNLAAPFLFALLLNEVRHIAFKRIVQTLVYLPHFMSWVILGGILLDLLSPKGIINQALGFLFGMKPIFFLGDSSYFRFTAVLSDVWKEFGFGTILFLASLANINPALYEAAEMDGASRWKQTLYITIPGIMPITVVLMTLSLGNVLNGGFDQIFNIYNSMVYDKGDIIDTFVYREALISGGFSFGTAVGMFKSLIGFVMIVIAYRLAYKIANYRIF